MPSEVTASVVLRAVVVETIWMTKNAAIHGMAGVRTIFWRRTRMSYASGATSNSGTSVNLSAAALSSIEGLKFANNTRTSTATLAATQLGGGLASSLAVSGTSAKQAVVVNLSAGEGHPVEIMDLTFSVQALATRYLLRHGAELEPRVHLLPYEIDEGIALRKLETLGLEIDRLTDEQTAFRSSWEAFS